MCVHCCFVLTYPLERRWSFSYRTFETGIGMSHQLTTGNTYHCVHIDKSTYHSVTKCCSIRFVEDLLSLKFFAGMSTCIQAKFYTGDPKIFDKFCCGHTNAELCGDK